MNATMLSRLLTPRQRAAELEVREEADHFVTICRKDECLARWYITAHYPTVEAIQEQADRILEQDEHLFDFVKDMPA
jgi:hypothetical protein